MPLRNRVGRAHGANGAGSRRGGLWRLLACTEGGDTEEGEETSSCISEDKLRIRTRAERHRQMRLRTAEAAEGRQKSGRPAEQRRRRQGGGGGCGDGCTTDEGKAIATDSGRNFGGTADERRRRRLLQRRRRSSRRSGTLEVGEAASLEKPLLGKARSGGGGGGSHVNRRRPKRLVVAMLEDGDEDGETATARGGDWGGGGGGDRAGRRSGNLRLRTTLDERKIRRILHQLSTTMDASDEQLREFATLEIPNFIAQRSPKSPPSAATTARTAGTSHTMTMQPSLILRPQPTPPPLPERRHASQRQLQFSPTASAVQGNLKGEIPQQQKEQLQLLPAQQPPHQQTNQLQSYGVSQIPQQSVPETAVRGTGRRGYRLFRHVFSAADNYYAVPFPPLEKIQLNKDDDQWEDLEIYVASHKGMVSINPKTGKQESSKQQTSSPSKAGAATGVRQTPCIPRPTAPASAGPTALASAPAPEAGDQPVKCQQHKQTQKQPPAKSTTLRNIRAKPLEVTKTQFGYKHQQLLQHQQRRADPLSPSRLLSQLSSQATSTRRPAPLLMPPLTIPTAAQSTSARASQPMRRSQPSAMPSRSGGGNRCGKLNGMRPG